MDLKGDMSTNFHIYALSQKAFSQPLGGSWDLVSKVISYKYLN